MEIIQNRKQVESVSYSLDFEWNDTPGAGFGFNCDKDGNVDVANMSPCARENYEMCISREHDVRSLGVKKTVHRYTRPAVGKCECGAEVVLDSFTNTCVCGADYNSSGSRLSHRSFWGEETGETAADILGL